MSRQLRLCLLGIVVTNLLFVHITGAVSLHWLALLYGLTAIAPLIRPWHATLPYRLSWNLGIVLIFSLLLRDVMSSGVRFMLEDGLLLAAFCQVHVLNNLGRQRSPDLILFNSFLIALVTSFFCQDLVYSFVFVAYAGLLIAGTRIFATEADNGRHMDDGSALRLLRSGAGHSIVVVTATFVVFLFWPRNFEREGLVEDQLHQAVRLGSGVPDRIRLGSSLPTVPSEHVVLTATLLHGSRDRVPTLWRGITYLRGTLDGWQGERRPQPINEAPVMDQRWRQVAVSRFERPGPADAPRVAVTVHDPALKVVYAPLAIHRIDTNVPAHPMRDGCFRFDPRLGGEHDELGYEFMVHPQFQQAARPRVSPRAVEEYRRLDGRGLPAAAEHLYQEIRKGLRLSNDVTEIGEAFADALGSRFLYALPGAPGAASSYHTFLMGMGGGHCEYFASTLAFLLRRHGVACRMVGGFVAHEWDASGTRLTIRGKHAHAWVEAWDPSGNRWLTFDPTPAASMTETTTANAGLAWLRSLWSKLTTFDASARDRTLATALRWLEATGRSTLYWLPPLVLLALWWRRRQPRGDPDITAYHRELKRAGLVLHPGETPRRLIRRARQLPMPAARLDALEQATATHEARRFAKS